MRLKALTTKRSAKAEPKTNRKTQIIAAAEALLRENGLSGVTTKAIAQAVGCSEGAIYVHFEGRAHLLLTVLEQSLPAMVMPLKALEQRVGRGSPRSNLATAVKGLLEFHERVAPMLCSLFAEPALLESVRASLTERGKGPHGGIARLADYIRQEQKLGRIAAQVDAEASARSLMAGSFFHVFTQQLLGQKQTRVARQLIDLALGSSTK
ncbi:MAG: TetR/AcrR family transcriptional regulator [Acidobacteriota bacterium]